MNVVIKSKEHYLSEKNILIELLNKNDITEKELQFLSSILGHFYSLYEIDDDGVVRGQLSKEIPPFSMLGFWKHMHKPFNYDLSYDTKVKEEKENCLTNF